MYGVVQFVADKLQVTVRRAAELVHAAAQVILGI